MGTNENLKNIPISHDMIFKERENLRKYKKRKMMKNKRSESFLTDDTDTTTKVIPPSGSNPNSHKRDPFLTNATDATTKAMRKEFLQDKLKRIKMALGEPTGSNPP